MSKPLKEQDMKMLYNIVQESASPQKNSIGPNMLMVAREFIAVVNKIRLESGQHNWSPEFQVFLNDLQGNDFNDIFRVLPMFH